MFIITADVQGAVKTVKLLYVHFKLQCTKKVKGSSIWAGEETLKKCELVGNGEKQ